MAIGPAKEIKEPNDWQTVPAEPNDWQDVSADHSQPHVAPPTTGQKLAKFGVDAAKGLGESAVGLMSTGNHAVRKIPGIGEWLTTPITGTPADQAIAHTDELAKPVNSTQSFAKGVGDAAQFLIPGGAEEKAVSMVPKAFETAAKIGASALGAGAVNKAQGGSFGAGAAMGAGGSALGQAMKAAAPAVTEFAQGIHTPGMKTGNAILSETKGVLPNSIRNSARGVLYELNPQLDEAAKRASVRPNPAKALLPAPAREIPLSEPWIPDTPGELIPAAPFPRGNIVGGNSPRVASQLGSTESTIPPRLTRDDLFMHSGVREPTPLPTSGPGVLIRPSEAQSGAIPELRNETMSLKPARETAQGYIDKANSQNLPKFIKGAKNLANQVNVWKETGEAIPENVTPWEGLQLKRGVGAAVSPTKWRPGYNDPFTGAQKSVYGQLNKAFENAVPEAAPLNSRISSLIPATKAGATSFSRYVSPAIGTMMGGYTGAMRGLQDRKEGEPLNIEKGIAGGLTGAALGGLTGYAAPTAMNVFARTANSPALQKFLIPAARGAALQADRKKKE